MMFRFVLLACALLIVVPKIGHSHCHNDGPGPENPFIVRGNLVWPPSKKNDQGVYEIDVYVNVLYRPNGVPSLNPDCNNAAGTWSDIHFRGNRIKFKYTMHTITGAFANEKDQKNVMAWKNIGRSNPTIAFTYFVDVDGSRIKELDVGFNYYKGWKNHDQSGGYYCIKEIATHELGHVAGLNDVYYYPQYPVTRVNCPHHAHYSMNGQFPSTNTHWREDLACEDKYALDQKYSYGP